jgi:adenosylhomocysteine nucleosidase
LAVDMETAAAAAVAANRRIPFLAVRVISDQVGHELPPELGSVFCDGRLRWGRLTAGCVRRPRLLRELLKLSRYSNQAAVKLAAFLEVLLRQNERLGEVAVPQPMTGAVSSTVE